MELISGSRILKFRGFSTCHFVRSCIRCSLAAHANTNGPSGNGRTFNAGVSVYTNAAVTTVSGRINVHGTGGTGTGDLMVGVTLQSGGVIESTASGSVSITGIGGSGTGNNHWGVDLAGSTVRVSTVNGPLNITGTGTFTTGVNSHRIAVITGASVRTTGSGNVTINATGASPLRTSPWLSRGLLKGWCATTQNCPGRPDVTCSHTPTSSLVLCAGHHRGAAGVRQ